MSETHNGAPVADLNARRAKRVALDAELHTREVQDYRAVMAERPQQTARGVYWCAVRPPEAFEMADAGPDVVVTVTAAAVGLSLHLSRQIWRRVSGAPIPADRAALGDLIRSGECQFVGEVVCAKATPPLGLKLRIELEETDARGRVVVGMEREKA